VQMKRLEKGQRRGAVASVANYALQAGCRRKKLLAHFGEVRAQCDPQVELLCDHCSNRSVVLKDLTALERFGEQQQEIAAGRHDDSHSNMPTTSGRHQGKALQPIKTCASLLVF
jgi:RecQ zinc-binding